MEPALFGSLHVNYFVNSPTEAKSSCVSSIDLRSDKSIAGGFKVDNSGRSEAGAIPATSGYSNVESAK
jgi:hypothetical protein